MKSSLIVLIILLAVQSNVSAQKDMKRQKVTKEISMKVPNSFILMGVGEVNNKYVSYRTPIAMYTSQDGLVDLGINKNSTEWAGDDLNILKDFYTANIQNLFSEVKFLQSAIQQVGDREFIILEFISKMNDEEKTFGGMSSPISKYTYIMYTLYNDSVLLFNFSCDAKLRAEWQPAAGGMMQSVRIK